MCDFVCGANEAGFHYKGVNFGRDLDEPETVDLRNVVAGDPTPGGTGTLSIARGIEVGHIFQLGDKYSEAMDATVQDPDGNKRVMAMGCYGIGITRIVGAAIEQNHDDNGIIWPGPLAPFDVVLVPINMQRSDAVREAAEALYTELTTPGSRCCSMTAMCGRASSSPMPSSSAFRTDWSSASAAWPRVNSNTAIVATRSRAT